MRLPFGWELRRGSPRRPGVWRRMFAAARSDNTTADWPSDTESIDEILRAHLRVLRGRSRHECRNNPYGKQYVRLCKTNVIGDTGIRLQARARDASGKLDKAVNREIEERWREWGEGRFCDFERTLTWWQMEQLLTGTEAQDGEGILRVHLYEPDNPFGVSFQIIDPELLDVDYWTDLSDGRYVRLGVEYDARRRPIAYHFLNSRNGRSLGDRRIRVPASEILHGFERLDAGQSRGIPGLTAALYQMRQGGAFADAAVVAARSGAVRGGFFVPALGTSGYKGDDKDDQGNPVIELSPDHQFETLPEGWTYSPYSPEYPRGEFAPFDKAVSRRTAAGSGVSYAALTGDLSETSFASMRQGVNYERDVWKVLQRQMVSNYHSRVHRLWIRAQMLMGTLTQDGRTFDVSREAEYRRALWQPRSWAYVNPQQDAQADKIQIESCARTVSDVIRARGDDPDETMEEYANDMKRFAELGIPWPYGNGSDQSAPPSTSDSEDEQAKAEEKGQ